MLSAAVTASLCLGEHWAPLDPAEPRAVTEWAALDGRRAAPTSGEVAARHQISVDTLTGCIRTVSRFSSRHLQLGNLMLTECTGWSALTELLLHPGLSGPGG